MIRNLWKEKKMEVTKGINGRMKTEKENTEKKHKVMNEILFKGVKGTRPKH